VTEKLVCPEFDVLLMLTYYYHDGIRVSIEESDATFQCVIASAGLLVHYSSSVINAFEIIAAQWRIDHGGIEAVGTRFMVHDLWSIVLWWMLILRRPLIIRVLEWLLLMKLWFMHVKIRRILGFWNLK